MGDVVHADKPLIAIAGASGFVGTHLRRYLEKDFNFRALTRSPSVVERNHSEASVEWQHCDLYSLPKVTEALEGCELGIYLVHSMAPSSRLIQADFEDTDLLLADNFIRAAEAVGIKHVIYLSGLMPEAGVEPSPHLRSRCEVEAVLRSRSVQVTVLRAGLIFGPGGSSFSMLVNLVRRLPVMILPKWTSSLTQSIDVQNVCEAFELCLTDPGLAGEIYDLGGHAPMRYAEMIEGTARALGRRVLSLRFPANCFALSRRWVALYGSVPMALVGPLLESLQFDLQARPNALLERLRANLIPFEESLRRAVQDGVPKANPRASTQQSDRQRIRKQSRVRSVQRMHLPTGCTAQQVSKEYGEWLTRFHLGLIRVPQGEDGVIRFVALGKVVLLELTPTPYTVANQRRCAYYISGGVLAREVQPPGRLEFRLFPDSGCLIASIHGFAPRLPWWFYWCTQAKIHLFVMWMFGKHLAKQ